MSVEDIAKPAIDPSLSGLLQGLRVVETGDIGELAGLTLAGLGCEVLKIEPPEGSRTRRLRPFMPHPHDAVSMAFLASNRGKKSIVIDVENNQDIQVLTRLLQSSDILLDSCRSPLLEKIGIEPSEAETLFPNLIVARLSPFGDTGPWKDYEGSDIVHAALGGILMNCGYDPRPDGTYDLPPFLPHYAHSYHIAADQLLIGVIGALFHRARTGESQEVSCAIHEAVSKSTETDLMSWVMVRTPYMRQTARHSMPTVTDDWTIVHTKDGRWLTASSVG